jgi:sRNA-binding carbon storage regulator CsrA
VKIGISAPGEVQVLRQELWHEDAPWETKERNGNPTAGPSSASA